MENKTNDKIKVEDKLKEQQVEKDSKKNGYIVRD